MAWSYSHGELLLKDLPSLDTAAPELMLQSLSVVRIVTCPDHHFALPSQNTSFGRLKSEQNGVLAMRDYSKTGIPVVVDREVVVDVAIDEYWYERRCEVMLNCVMQLTPCPTPMPLTPACWVHQVE